MKQIIEQFIADVEKRNLHEPEFMQAVREVAESVIPYIVQHDIYHGKNILMRMAEPERVISFRVPWIDDTEKFVNRGFRIEMNLQIGPTRVDCGFTNPSTWYLKFLAFEQVFKNALTTLPMGGGKGGADFDPKGKSDGEVMRFCQVYDIVSAIGPNRDIPAGDIGVGGREIGYMFGQYKRLKNEFTGVLTGKGISWGGSMIRPEATGYGAVYFAENMLSTKSDGLQGKSVVISGSGNVAQYAAEKCIQLGAKVLTLSDSSGYVMDPDGIDADKLKFVMDLKNNKRERISKYVDTYAHASFHAGERPWAVPCDVALPCATQNELHENDAKQLANNGCICVSEGANMPSTPQAIQVFHANKMLYAPGKASNAGGVAVSGLEMAQNSLRYSWTREEVDERLQAIMSDIHKSCVAYGRMAIMSTMKKGQYRWLCKRLM